MKLKIFLALMVLLFVGYGVWRGDVGIEYQNEYIPIDSAIIYFHQRFRHEPLDTWAA